MDMHGSLVRGRDCGEATTQEIHLDSVLITHDLVSMTFIGPDALNQVRASQPGPGLCLLATPSIDHVE